MLGDVGQLIMISMVERMLQIPDHHQQVAHFFYGGADDLRHDNNFLNKFIDASVYESKMTKNMQTYVKSKKNYMEIWKYMENPLK